ncbi:MAG: flagellar hook-basal body complex protein [Clostridiales bacterium]|nr:flagellar hook-basal body complex protein [Clostridiales bacterium]
MMRSLFSGVSGLKVHQTKMDVIGNNIANVNTAGFKSSSVVFSDILYQTTQAATGPNPSTGAAGQNPMQIGLGANVSSITTNISGSGGSERTDNPFDIRITGDAFFIVNSGGTNYFTKAGSFKVDANGTLCTSFGAPVMGWQPDEEGQEIVQDAVSPLTIMSAENTYAEPEATKNCYVTGNIDQKDSQLASDGVGKPVQIGFFDSLGNSYLVKVSLKQVANKPNEYTVSLTDIVDSENKSIMTKTTVDTTGKETISASGLSVSFNGVTYAYDTTSGTIKANGTENSLVFDAATGKFVNAGTTASGTDVKKALDLKMSTTDTTSPFKGDGQTVSIDFSTITMYSQSGSSSLEAKKGTSSTDNTGAGKKVGNMTGVSIDASGKIRGTYDNGTSKLLGQIAVATFPNASGLESVGNNMFAATKNSGEFDGMGKDPTAGGNSLTTGVLEMSNVDLSSEFTSMITTQRGFQANSRIITTSDTMLEELVNLKR